MYNVNYALETKIKAANTDGALKDAILHISSSIVTDMQNIDKRREDADRELARHIQGLEHQLSTLRAEVDQLRRSFGQ